MKKIYLVPSIKRHVIHGNDFLDIPLKGASAGGNAQGSGTKQRGSFEEGGNTDFWGNSEEE